MYVLELAVLESYTLKQTYVVGLVSINAECRRSQRDTLLWRCIDFTTSLTGG